MSVLEVSKRKMYETFYGPIQRLSEPRLLFTDTDSFLIHTTNSNSAEEFEKIVDIMDFSNFPSDHPLYSTTNKKVMGFYKDETGGGQISEFIGLKAKCYALDVEGASTPSVRCIGIKKNWIKRHLTMNHFRNVIKNTGFKRAHLNMLRGKDHKMFVQKVNKMALNSFDNKRFLKDCGICSLSYGNHRISLENSSKCHRNW